ncbi:MAG: outer membrane beta-barrel protein [Ignavibacteria bacterium]
MKKILFIKTLFLVSLFLIARTGNSQPKFTISIYGGYSVPLQDFKTAVTGDGTDSTLFPYYAKQGYNFGVLGKLGIGKKRNVKVTLGFNFNGFTNSVDLNNIYYPGNTVTFIPHVNIITITGGGEYDFLPKGKINPFIGLDVTLNIWNGSFRFDNSGDTLPEYYPTKMKSETRLGFQVGAGAEYSIGKDMGLVAGVKYNMANLIGKSYTDPSTLASTDVQLGDKANNGNPARNISYLQIYGGFVFYLSPQNKTEKK